MAILDQPISEPLHAAVCLDGWRVRRFMSFCAGVVYGIERELLQLFLKTLCKARGTSVRKRLFRILTGFPVLEPLSADIAGIGQHHIVDGRKIAAQVSVGGYGSITMVPSPASAR